MYCFTTHCDMDVCVRHVCVVEGRSLYFIVSCCAVFMVRLGFSFCLNVSWIPSLVFYHCV